MSLPPWQVLAPNREYAPYFVSNDRAHLYPQKPATGSWSIVQRFPAMGIPVEKRVTYPMAPPHWQVLAAEHKREAGGYTNDGSNGRTSDGNASNGHSSKSNSNNGHPYISAMLPTLPLSCESNLTPEKLRERDLRGFTATPPKMLSAAQKMRWTMRYKELFEKNDQDPRHQRARAELRKLKRLGELADGVEQEVDNESDFWDEWWPGSYERAVEEAD
ncbi:hypothetical protein MMC28_008037 [Mycoblastus sanguinarius]|nr:hypothetical protein [Mycoblastus sanguinarius]